MPLEFSNDFCTPCEPSARVWHKVNDPMRRSRVAIIVVDVDLQQIRRPSAILMDTCRKHFTHSLRFNECVVASDKVMSICKEARSAHVEILKMEVQDEGGRRQNPGNQSRHDMCWYLVGLFLYSCKHVLELSLGLLLVSDFLVPRYPEMAVHSFW